MSRHRHQPSPEQRRQVMTMAGFGIPQLEIARLINISDRTLRTRYRRELDTGATEANLRVAQSLYSLAVKERNVSACIWWTKARMGWREQQDLSIGGNGQPVTYEFHWREPEPVAAPKPAPVIDGEPADASAAAPLVVWEGGDRC